MEGEIKRHRKILDEGVSGLIDNGNPTRGHLASGEPVEQICAVAQKLKVDLIVVTHHYQESFATRWWKGSVGASLMEKAPCSILIAISGKR